MSKTLKFLVIDDDDTVQSIIGAFINRYMEENNLNGTIKRVTDPVQGLFILNTHGNEYDAILLDVRLPKLTGDEIYNSLISLEQDFIKRIMFVTGYANDLIARFPDLELNILNKPFRYQDLSARIDELIKLD
jgi:DNA-binding response OmpR family regulator